MVRVCNNNANFERLEQAAELGEKKGCCGMPIAIAYVLHQPFPIFPIIGPAELQELGSSLDALQIELSHDDMRWLNLND